MVRNGKKKVLEVEKSKEHPERLAKRQHTTPSRESIIEVEAKRSIQVIKGPW